MKAEWMKTRERPRPDPSDPVAWYYSLEKPMGARLGMRPPHISGDPDCSCDGCWPVTT